VGRGDCAPAAGHGRDARENHGRDDLATMDDSARGVKLRGPGFDDVSRRRLCSHSVLPQ